mmetsp:Transcript_89388/g.239086  ORF Transcript_89388/g.239086 Transcript_89388/m.239086 type:complete len:212 (-) Transcript_89388:895-1530(-)
MSTVMTAKAAFSKSVSWTSMERNSTRHPTPPVSLAPPTGGGGGGFHRTVCQLVDWMFSKWSVLVVSLMCTRSRKMTRGSRTKRCAMCLASRLSMPADTSVSMVHSSTGHGMSLFLSVLRSGSRPSRQLHMKEEMDSYLDLLRIRAPPPAIHGIWPRWAGEHTSWPRSCGVRSSTLAAMVAHRTSVSASRPRRMGVAAESASMMGHRTASWS